MSWLATRASQGGVPRLVCDGHVCQVILTGHPTSAAARTAARAAGWRCVYNGGWHDWCPMCAPPRLRPDRRLSLR